MAVDGRIRPGPALTRLAGSNFPDVVGAARPHQEALARATRETVDLSVLRGNQAVLVDRIASDHEPRVVTPVGSAPPLHCSAHGKALPAAMAAAEVARRLGDERLRRTPHTIVALAPLLKELAGLRRRVVRRGRAPRGRQRHRRGLGDSHRRTPSPVGGHARVRYKDVRTPISQRMGHAAPAIAASF